MKVRGQNPQAWASRWRQGTCPVHGRGLITSDDSGDPEDGITAVCTKEECTVEAVLWPGKDRWHSVLGWQSGPDEIRAALAKTSDIPDEGPRPGIQARMVRTAWPTGEEDIL